MNLKKFFGREMIGQLIKRKSVSNGMWMYLLQICNTVIPLLTLPYITRVLGTSRYGVFSIVINLIGYMQVVIEYGFGMSATRKVALMESDKELNCLFSSVILSRVILMAGCWIFVGVYIALNRDDLVLCQCVLVLSLCLLGYCLQQDWLFQGKQDMKLLSLISIIGRSVSTVLIFLLVKTENDLPVYCILYAISPLIMGVAGFIIGMRRYKISFVRVKFVAVIAELKSGWYVFTTQLSAKVFGAIGVTFLGLFSPSSVVGIFSAIQKIPNVLTLAWLPISQVLYPISSKRMTDSFEEGIAFINKIRKPVLIVFAIILIAIAVPAKMVVEIAFGAEYAEYYYWVYPLLGWILVCINDNFWGIQILLGSGHDKEYSQCFQISVVLTIIINFVFVYFVGGLGAAFAPLVSELCLSGLLFNKIRKIEKMCNPPQSPEF